MEGETLDCVFEQAVIKWLELIGGAISDVEVNFIDKLLVYH